MLKRSTVFIIWKCHFTVLLWEMKKRKTKALTVSDLTVPITLKERRKQPVQVQSLLSYCLLVDLVVFMVNIVFG